MDPVGVSQIYINTEDKIAVVVFHNDDHGYIFDFNHINELIDEAVKKVEDPIYHICETLQKKLRIYYKTTELIGLQLLRNQLEQSHRIFDALFRQSQELLQYLSQAKQIIPLPIVNDINWAFRFYETFYNKLMNSLVEFHCGDTDKLIAINDISDLKRYMKLSF